MTVRLLRNWTPGEKRNLSKFISKQAKELKKKDQTNEELQKKIREESQAREVEEKRRIFAELEISIDKSRMLQLHHQIGIVAGELRERMEELVGQYRKNAKSFTKYDLFSLIESNLLGIKKIENTAKLATKANFDIATNRIHADIIQFIREYLENFRDISYGWGIDVQFVNEKELEHKIKFRPVEITMLIDNLIDNAGKSDAKLMVVTVLSGNGNMVLEFDDDGTGLTNRFAAPQLFEKGVTTTSGSGIGLWHAKQVVEELGGNIEISNNHNGARIRMEFTK